MFIKRAKSRPSIRARESETSTAPSPLGKSSITADDPINVDDEDEEVGVGSFLEKKKSQKKDKRLSGLKSGSSRLSFGDNNGSAEGDDSGEGFKPRKSLLSQNIKLPQPSVPSEPVAGPSKPSYSQQYLSELKASTPTRLSGNKASVEDDMDVDDNDEDVNGLSRIARDKYSSRFQEDTTMGIPDAAAIASARMKRQAKIESSKHGLDQNGDGEEDYISLGGGKLIVHDGTEGPHPESRLMREEDEDDEGDLDLADFTEANDKLFIGKRARKDAARRERGEIGDMIADREAEEESDEETREWEAAQARRAGNYDDDRPEPSKKGYIPAPIPTSRPIPTIGPVQARISKALGDLRITKSENEHNLEIASTELKALEEQERDLRVEVEKVESKREWVEEFRGWVEMLGGFLEEKIPKLDSIASDFLAHLKERSEMIGKRRQLDDSDDLSLFLGIPQSIPSEEIEEVDELGRSRTNHEAGPSSGVRKARRSERTQRRSRRQSRQRPSQAGEEEGYSTDSSLKEADLEDYDLAQNQLNMRVEALLDDVKAEDFRDPERGLAVRFGDWRKRYEDEYVGAFGGLSMVQAWQFWARGEMVGWEPFRNDTNIENFTWFLALHAYSHPRLTKAPDMDSAMDEGEPPLGPDGDLAAQMVNDAVVPLLIKAVENGAYDLYSTPQTRRAIDILEVVEDLAGGDNRKFNSLLKAIINSFSSHILTLSSIIASCISPQSTPPPAFDPNSRDSLQRYVRKRIKLVKNLMMWRRFAADEVRQIVGRLCREIIKPVVLKGWDGGGREVAGEVVLATQGVLANDLVILFKNGP